MYKPQNIYWIGTEDGCNNISMQAPGRCLYPKRKKCCPKQDVKKIHIDNSNTISIEQENEQTFKNNRVQGGDIVGGTQANTATVDATQVSVFVLVPIIDSFDVDAIPLKGPGNQYRIAAGGEDLDIQVNGDGTAYINGEKIEESEMGDGARVFIYKNNKVEKDQG